MRTIAPLLCALTLAGAGAARAQVAGRFPPESLINTRVIPRGTPVINVIGQMRDITGALGVRCQYCHVGEEGLPLERFDFASDTKRTKLAAREMMRMVQAINGDFLPRLPERPDTTVRVACMTCHRGIARPIPLQTVLIDATVAAGVDSAVRAYRALRTRYYGHDAYDFSAQTLAIAAFRLARFNQRYDDALALIALNEEQNPGVSMNQVFRGNILLMRADTNGAAAAFNEALRRDPTNTEARGRLRQIGRPAR